MNNLDKNFEQLMKSQKRNSPSPRFSLNVMDKIYQLNHQFSYKPVIGKWGWRIIFISFGIFVAYIMTNGTTTGTEGNWNLLEKFASLIPEHKSVLTGTPEIPAIEGFKRFFQNMPLVLSLTIIASSLLLMVDQLLLKKKVKKH